MRHDTIESWRRDEQRLAWLNRILGFAAMAFMGAVIWFIFVLQRTDFVYFILSVAGLTGGLGRLFVWRVRSVPEPVRRLAFGDPAAADEAWRLIENHRAELMNATYLPGTIHEKPLLELTREELAERVRRVSPGDGRRALRLFLVLWSVLAVVAILAVVLHTPAPRQMFSPLRPSSQAGFSPAG